MELIEAAMKWIVAPIAAFVLLQYKTQQAHGTDIAVLKAQAVANKEAHDREFKQLQDSFKAVFTLFNGKPNQDVQRWEQDGAFVLVQPH